MAAFRKAASVFRVTDLCLQNLHILWLSIATQIARALHCDISFPEAGHGRVVVIDGRELRKKVDGVVFNVFRAFEGSQAHGHIHERSDGTGTPLIMKQET